jgi:hypothetical protein
VASLGHRPRHTDLVQQHGELSALGLPSFRRVQKGDLRILVQDPKMHPEADDRP